jgi:hypothetical protein
MRAPRRTRSAPPGAGVVVVALDGTADLEAAGQASRILNSRSIAPGDAAGRAAGSRKERFRWTKGNAGR